MLMVNVWVNGIKTSLNVKHFLWEKIQLYKKTTSQAMFTFSDAQFLSVLWITDQIKEFMFYAVDSKIEKNKITTLTSPV